MDRLDRQVRRELGRFEPVGGDTGDMPGIVRAWPAAVGETVARNAWPARLDRNGTLHVHTLSATWAFELGRLAARVLEQLRAELGEKSPPALRFVPGPIPELAPAAAERRRPHPEIAAEHRAEAAGIAAGIEDEELRELVARAAAASLARVSREAGADRGF